MMQIINDILNCRHGLQIRASGGIQKLIDTFGMPDTLTKQRYTISGDTGDTLLVEDIKYPSWAKKKHHNDK